MRQDEATDQRVSLRAENLSPKADTYRTARVRVAVIGKGAGTRPPFAPSGAVRNGLVRLTMSEPAPISPHGPF